MLELEFRKIRFINLLLVCCIAALLLLCHTGLLQAADIKVAPSAARVSPGGNFYIDIIVENIPSTGLGAVQFRLNIDGQGSTVTGVSDISQGIASDVSVSIPLIVGPPTSSRSGIGEFFYNATGPYGILIMDNDENLNNGSGLYTFSHTNGSTPPSGSGSVARFHFMIGQDVAAEKIIITLTEVMLLDTETVYSLDSNTGATIELRCITEVPNILGLSQDDAQTSLSNSRLSIGNIYEIENWDKRYELNKVLAQSYAAGTSIFCDTLVHIAINTAPLDVGSLNVIDKINDESGTIILSWVPSTSIDTVGYRIYLISNTEVLLSEIRNPGSTENEITGLPNGQQSQIKITVFDNFGNESQGVIISAMPVDDIAPRITIEGVTDGAFYVTDVVPIITVLDANLAAKEITLNGAPYNTGAISLDGNYILRVKATDASGNTTTKEVSFIIDKTPPVITVTGIEKGKYYNVNLNPVITVVDANLQSVNSFLNGNPFTSGSTITAEGTYELRIEASDKAGNSSSDTYIFYIDKTKPISNIAIGEPKFEKAGSIFVTASTSFTLAGKDEGILISGVDRLEYRINNSQWNNYQAPFLLSGVNDGTIRIDYRVIDKAGNIEDLHTITVVLDNALPLSTINIGTPQYQANGNIYVSGVTELSISTVDSGSGIKGTEYSIDGGSFITYTGAITLASYSEGTHTISYRSIDNIGNLEKTKTLIVILDKTPSESTISATDPLITGVINTISPNTRFTLNATDNLSGVKEILYRIDNGSWQKYITSFVLSVAGEHTIAYKSTDNVLNQEAEKTLAVRLITIDVTKEVSLKPVVLAAAWLLKDSGHGHWDKDNDNDKDKDNYKGHHDENDDIDKDKETRDKTNALHKLMNILSSAGISYYIPHGNDDFEETFRSGRFNVYILIDFNDESLNDEIREAVNYGNGLVFIKTRHINDTDLDDVFGARFKHRSEERGLPIHLLQSPISNAGTLQTDSRTRVVRTEIISATAQSFGNVIDRKRTYPAILSNQYGRGKVILFSFDLFSCPDHAKAAELLVNSINYVKPTKHYLMTLDSVPVTIKIANSTAPVELRITETLPANTSADLVYPETTQTESTITWQKSLSADETAIFSYYLELPDLKGDFTLNTEVKYNSNGNYNLYGNYTLTLSILNNSTELLQAIITELRSISPSNHKDREKIREAIEELSEIHANASNRKQAERNIKRIIKAIKEIRALSFSASDIRLKLDEILNVWEMKWYLMKPMKH